MSGAALALALALLIAPAPHRVRVRREPVPSLPPRAVVATCATAMAFALALLTSPGVTAAVALIGVTLWIRRRRRQRDRRRTAEAAALQGALDVLVGELRVGAHPAAAFGVAANEVDGAVATSMRTVAARARMGADVAEGMRSVARQSSLPEFWERLAVCWGLAQAHGLAIATMLQTAQRDIVERQRFSARVSAGMAGARTTASVLAGLPVIGIALGQLIGADPFEFLLSPGAGGWLLVVGVALACAGLLWSDQITSRVTK